MCKHDDGCNAPEGECSGACITQETSSETLENVVMRLLNAHLEKSALMPNYHAFARYLLSDPAFRRLMAEELVKVDIEPQWVHLKGKIVEAFTQDQLTAAVLKEREEIAQAVEDKFDFCGDEIIVADFVRSRTERTE